jgi:ubiquinone/menaquinone biosynthesis C-methylase UbiE
MAGERDGWQLSGTAPELYERILVPAVTRPWANDLVDRVGVRPGDQVLDVACGTGVVARVAVERMEDRGVAVGLDVNPGMVSMARSLPSAPGVPVEWVEASALSLPFPDRRFDAVLCQLGLQFFPDRPRSLREMRRVLVPGGRLGVSVFAAIDQNPATNALADALDAHVGTEASNVKRNEHSLGDAGELRELVREAGFSAAAVETVTRTVTFPSVADYVHIQLWATPLASLLSGVGPDERQRAVALVSADIGERLAEFTTEGVLAFPQRVHVAIATA